MTSLTRKITFGAAWMVSLRLVVRSIGLVSTLILVRLLDPSDFGIVAMAMTVVGAIELLTAFGFDVTLIQDQDAGPDEYNTAWTLSAALGAAAALLIAILAYPAASFYEEPRLVSVFQIIALASLLQGLENIGLVDFRKHLEFHKEFIFQVAIKIVGFFVTIGLAFALRSYWALVIGTVSSRLVSLALSYWVHPYRPSVSLASLHKVMSFSKWLFVNNLLYFVRFRGPDFIVGKFMGVTGLGIFTVSYEISNLPTTELIAPINRALLPGFSMISGDIDRSRGAFVQAAAVLALVSLPIGLGLAATAELFTPILLGEKWLEAIPIIKILAIFGASVAIQSPIGTVLLALGKPRLLGILSGWHAVILIAATIVLASNAGLEGAAWALLLSFVAFLPIYYGFAARSIGLTAANIMTIFLRPVIASTVMYLSVTYLFSSSLPTVTNLAFATATGVLAFVATNLLMWLGSSRSSDSAEYYFIRFVTEKLAANRART